MKGKKVLEIILFWSTMAYLLFFFLKHFVFAIYEVPSGSMLGTIWPGDYIITEKLSFGPRITWQNKQYRLPGVSSMERGDVLVFNFPEGDTVFVNNPAKNYYEQVRWNICKKEILRMYGKTTVLPVNYRVPYVKRCMGLPGDTLIIKNGEVNVCKSKNIWQIRNLYCVYSDLGAWNFIDSLPNYPADKYDGESCKLVALTSSESSELSKAFGIDSVVPKIDDRNFVNTFPFVKKKLVK
jgi:signal peptidase I